ncbi:MAG: MFS transporter [Microbacterium enclense]
MQSRDNRRHGYRWLWGASAGAALGDGLSSTTFPLLIASQTRDPLIVSLLQVATGLPWLLFGLVAGTLVDRWDRRAVMWRTDLARVCIVLVLGVLVARGHAPVVVVLFAAFLLACGSTLIRSAAPALLPTLVPREQLARANGRLQAGATLSGSFVGPAAGSVLHSFSASAPVLAQTVAFIASAVCVGRLPAAASVEAARSSRRSIWIETAEGLRWLFAHRVLRSVAVGTVLLAASTGVLLAVLVIHVLDVLDVPAAGYGLLIAVYAGGSVMGSLLAARLRRRLGTNRCLLISALLGTVSIAVLAVAPSAVLAGAALIVLGVATMLWNILAVTVRQEFTPDHLLGRVTSAFAVVGVGTAPIAAPLGGIVASLTSTSVAIGFAAMLCALACIPVGRLPDLDRVGHTPPETPPHP